jgi:hypothetical protein
MSIRDIKFSLGWSIFSVAFHPGNKPQHSDSTPFTLPSPPAEEGLSHINFLTESPRRDTNDGLHSFLRHKKACTVPATRCWMRL